MVRIYYAYTDKIDPVGVHRLSQYRKERIAALVDIDKRRQSIGAELLLNMALEELAPEISIPADIKTDDNGKPFIASGSLHFSLAHSGALSACAVSEKPIGLDVQLEEEPRERIIRRVFSTEEVEFLNFSEDKSYAFTKLWTMKESKVKQNGKGIGAMLGGTEVLSDEKIWHCKISDYHFALCSEDKLSSGPDAIIKIEL